MNAVIKDIESGSIAAKTSIKTGDMLQKINGNEIVDVLDYMYYSYDKTLRLQLLTPQWKYKLLNISKDEGESLGLNFETYLMDDERSCANRCIFCFIDQNPMNMRSTIYYKDDDVRLSFFKGNYITLTNLSEEDVQRIIKLRISPINISVHTLNPTLRAHMLGNKRGGESIAILKRLADAGITLNCQIVCCPGVNDGAELQSSIKGLIDLGKNINSVSVVPVGLTKYRQGLPELTPFNREIARKVIRIVEFYGHKCLMERGSRVFFCADEIYVKAGLKLPQDEFYEVYPQLENGVGMMTLLMTEFDEAMDDMDADKQNIRRLKKLKGKTLEQSKFTVATGVTAAGYLTKLLNKASARYDRINGTVLSIDNEFFGSSVTVSGLITGGDIISQLKGKDLGERLLIPINMLRHGEDVFLDDVKVSDVSKALGVNVRVVKRDGADLLQAFLGS